MPRDDNAAITYSDLERPEFKGTLLRNQEYALHGLQRTASSAAADISWASRKAAGEDGKLRMTPQRRLLVLGNESLLVVSSAFTDKDVQAAVQTVSRTTTLPTFVASVLASALLRNVIATESRQTHDAVKAATVIKDAFVPSQRKSRKSSGFRVWFNEKTYFTNVREPIWYDFIRVQVPNGVDIAGSNEKVYDPLMCFFYNQQQTVYSPTLLSMMVDYCKRKNIKNSRGIFQLTLPSLLRAMYIQYLSTVFTDMTATKKEIEQEGDILKSRLGQQLQRGLNAIYQLTVLLYSLVVDPGTNKTIVLHVSAGKRKTPMNPLRQLWTKFGFITGNRVQFQRWLDTYLLVLTRGNRKAEVKHTANLERMGVYHPTVIRADQVWGVCGRLIKMALPQLGGDRRTWKDAIFDSFALGQHLDENEDARCALVLLLQICIGSRSMGILTANYISPSLHVDEATASFAAGTGHRDQCVTIRGITKDRDLAKRVERALGFSMEAYPDNTKDEVREILFAEFDQKTITKPVQSYFLNEANYKLHYLDGVPNEEEEGDDIAAALNDAAPSTNAASSMHVFFLLFQALRLSLSRLHKHNRKDEIAIEWAEHMWTPTSYDGNTDFADHPFIEMTDDGYKNQAYITALYRPRMNQLLRTVFEQVSMPPKLYSKQTGSHTCRKLYVNYSFYVFGQQFKEIGWAQQVLQHESFDSSLHYLNLKIDFGAVGSQQISLTYNEADVFKTSVLNAVREEVTRVLEEEGEEVAPRAKRKADLELHLSDGSVRVVKRLARAPRNGRDSDERRQEVVAKIAELQDIDQEEQVLALARGKRPTRFATHMNFNKLGLNPVVYNAL